MAIIGLDHVAIATANIDAAIRRLAEDFGIPLSGREDVPTENTSTAFFPLQGTRIELITPMEPGVGNVARSLEKRGEGVHHLCFRTDDILADMERLSAKGYRFLGASTCSCSDLHDPLTHGCDTRRVNVCGV